MQYRLYSLSEEDHIAACTEISSETDRDATAQAAAALGHHVAIEVWQGTRRVGRVGRDAPTAALPKRQGKFFGFFARLASR
jgi:hypothetical protein